jgi:hypothetical protein
VIECAVAEYFGRVHCGIDNLLIPGTTAQITGNGEANLRAGRIGIFFQKILDDHQHPRRTEAALQSMVAMKRRLQRMQLVWIDAQLVERLVYPSERLRSDVLQGSELAGAEGFNRPDPATGSLPRQYVTGLDDGTIQFNRTATASPFETAVVSAGQACNVTDEFEQQQPIVYIGRHGSPVNVDRQVAHCRQFSYRAPLSSHVTPGTPLKLDISIHSMPGGVNGLRIARRVE